MRKAAYAGKFYSGSPIALKEEIESAIAHRLGPGKGRVPIILAKKKVVLKEEGENKLQRKALHGEGQTVEGYGKKARKGAYGAVCPHAGYAYSGPGAAHCYMRISQGARPGLFVILSFSHRCLEKGPVGASTVNWQTPLGIIETDPLALQEALTVNGIVPDDHAHAFEHSAEVQLPFIQHLWKDSKIVVLSVSNRCRFEETGRSLQRALSRFRPVYIASSDFTHYGPLYRFDPFPALGYDEKKARITELDMGAVKRILTLDSPGFRYYLQETGATICGSSPILLLIEIMRSVDAEDKGAFAGKKKAIKGRLTGELLSYYTSGDITGDYTNSVSYAGIMFE